MTGRKFGDEAVGVADEVDAFNAFEAYGLDPAGRVRTDGRLDETKLDSFMDAVADTTLATRTGRETSQPRSSYARPDS